MTHSRPRLLSYLILASLLCTPVAVCGQQLEIDKDASGIRIIQKNPPKNTAPHVKEPPRQDETPPPDTGTPAPEAPGTPDDKSAIPLEENPEYIAALNKLTEEYNRRSQELQQRADDLDDDYERRMRELMERVREVERDLLSIQNVEGTKRRFQELQEVLDDRQQDVDDADRLYTREREDLLAEKDELDSWYEKEQRKLKERMR